MDEQRSQKNGQKQTILIAEDEELLAEAISATLDIEGLETVIVHDGIEALTLARKLKPDLVLLDVMMPGRSGIEVCATLKTDAETSLIPVVLITAKSEEEDRAVGMAAGADAYVTKPFSPVHLIDLVKDLLTNKSAPPQHREPGISTMSPDQLTVYARDLKELWQRERREREALEEVRQRLKELDQLKADFLSTVTHELLTPFAFIGLALEVLQQQGDFADLAALDDLATGIADLHQRIKGVVKFAELVNKQREPEFGYYTLDQIVPWAVQPVAVMAQSRDVDFRVFIPDDLHEVHIDPELVSEALFQMAHNAVKFNNPGGNAQVRVSESKSEVVVEVSDTGIGLTPERLAVLGHAFEQGADALRRGQEGLGIGWAFVCYVAKVHNGWTHVKSPGKGHGSTFSLGLPLATDQTSQPINQKIPNEQRKRRKEHE